jgi:hypothetical protein
LPYVVGLCSKGTPQASQAGSCSMPRPIASSSEIWIDIESAPS